MNASNSNLWGIVDMGSNAVRFSIVSPTRLLPSRYHCRLPISLYDAQYPSPSSSRQPIPSAVINAIVSAISGFLVTCADFGVPPENIRILATEATRTAINGEQLIEAIKNIGNTSEDESRSAGKGALAKDHQITVLEKEEEARLGVLGVQSSFGSEARGIVMDMGGGSVQISVVYPQDDGAESVGVRNVSLPYGAAALSRLHAQMVQQKARRQSSSHLEQDTILASLASAFYSLAIPTPLQKDAEQNGGYRLYLSGGGFRAIGYLLMETWQWGFNSNSSVKGEDEKVEKPEQEEEDDPGEERRRKLEKRKDYNQKKRNKKKEEEKKVEKVEKAEKAERPGLLSSGMYPIPGIDGFEIDAGRVFGHEGGLQGLVERLLLNEVHPPHISARRLSQLPHTIALLSHIPSVIPLRSLHFSLSSITTGYLFGNLPSSERRLPALEVATSSFRQPHAANTDDQSLAAALVAALPESEAKDLNELAKALASTMFVHAEYARDVQASAALHFSLSGALASTRGITHTQRGLLAMALCFRYGGVGGLSFADRDLVRKLNVLVGGRRAWWSRYLGCVAALFAELWPAGSCSGAPSQRCSVVGSYVSGGEQGSRARVRVTVRIHEAFVERSRKWVGNLEKLGRRKKGRVAGYGRATDVKVEVFS